MVTYRWAHDNLVKVDCGAIELKDLGDGADGVLGGIDVLHRSTIRGLDHVAKERNSLRGGGGRARTTELAEHATTICGGLPHLRLGAGHAGKQPGEEDALVLLTLWTGVLHEVVEDAETPLKV